MAINEEKTNTLFKSVGRLVTTICKVIGPDDSTPGNKDPQAVGRIGIWPAFYPDSMDPKKVLWGYMSQPSGIGYGSKHHLCLNNQRLMVSFDDEGTPTILGFIPYSSGPEKPEGYNQYKEDTTYAPSQSESS